MTHSKRVVVLVDDGPRDGNLGTTAVEDLGTPSAFGWAGVDSVKS